MFKRIAERRPYRVHFNDGPFVENHHQSKSAIAEFRDGKELVYQVELPPGHWGKCYRRYFTTWEIRLRFRDLTPNRRLGFNLDGKRVIVNIDSRSLGDTLAWVPQVERFCDRHPRTPVLCCHFLGTGLFRTGAPISSSWNRAGHSRTSIRPVK